MLIFLLLLQLTLEADLPNYAPEESFSAVPSAAADEIDIQINPLYGFGPMKTKVKFRLPEPTEREICVIFDMEGIVWHSCFDGRADQLTYEKNYTLDAGLYEIWIEALGKRSLKQPVTVLERDAP